jgi:hypothetical protein
MVFPSQDIEFPITPGEGSESYLEAEDLRLDELERTSVDLDETLAGLAVGDGSSGLFFTKALH